MDMSETMPIGETQQETQQAEHDGANRQDAKRLRLQVIENKLAQAEQLSEAAANLRAEADLASRLTDEEVLSNYSSELQPAAPAHEQVEDAEPSDVQIVDRTLGLTGDNGVFPKPSLQQKELEAIDHWGADLDKIEELLRHTENFSVSEDDSKDFENLCHRSYEHSLTEAGMDIDEKDSAMRRAAETGDFDVQGGPIGNAWARLPKTNIYKQQSLQA